MSNEVYAAIVGAFVGGLISFGSLYFQYEKISKPTLENEKERISLDRERFQNETLKLQADISNLKLSIQQFEATERDKNISLLLDNTFQPKIKIETCTRNENFRIGKKKVIQISCSVKNEGKYSVIATEVIASGNVKEIFFYRNSQEKFTSDSRFNVLFYVRLHDNKSAGKAKIQFNTDPELVKDLKSLQNSATPIKIRTHVLNIVNF